MVTRPEEIPLLELLYERGLKNGLKAEKIGPEGLATLEPHAAGLAALYRPETNIVDFAHVADSPGKRCRGRWRGVVDGCSDGLETHRQRGRRTRCTTIRRVTFIENVNVSVQTASLRDKDGLAVRKTLPVTGGRLYFFNSCL